MNPSVPDFAEASYHWPLLGGIIKILLCPSAPLPFPVLSVRIVLRVLLLQGLCEEQGFIAGIAELLLSS